MKVKTLENGFRIYTFNKPGYLTKQAMIAVKFGSDIAGFYDEDVYYKIPLGTAHFIEHKMFASEDGGYIEKFVKNSAYANAYTSFDITAYYFTCRENFYENLSLLCQMVSATYFTEEGIKSERSIIEKEINMYRDNIRWKCYFTLLKQMYGNTPVSSFIAGTENEIAEITPDIMQKCFEHFYRPDNMALIIAGDIDDNKVFDVVSKEIGFRSSEYPVIDLPGTKKTGEKYVYTNANIKLPMFYIGMKYLPQNLTTEDIVKTNLYLELTAGDFSEIYEKLLNKKLIEDALSYEYLKGAYYNAAFISGMSQFPDEVFEFIKEELADKVFNADAENLSLAVKKLKGRFLMQQDDINALCCTAADCFVKNIDYLDIYNLYDKIEKENNFSYNGTEEIFLSVIGGKR